MKPLPLTLAVDLYGCPNRCLHCWLGHMPNRQMEPDADLWIVEQFRPYYRSITFFSWLREPDFCPDYRARWERDQQLSINAVPPRFELASFWRLVRDEDYVRFLKEVGVGCVQLTFFGLEETTDRYVGRKGAFRELLRATDILIENGITPRWQAFINEKNKDELVQLLHLTEELGFSCRCHSFRFFVHAGSCDGENRKLYPIRIQKGSIPAALIPYMPDYGELHTESELCAAWREDSSHVELHNEDSLVLYVANNYDLYFNFTHMRPEWRIGNMKTDPMQELIRRITEGDTLALRSARRITLGELVRRYGDQSSERAFEAEDYKIYLLNTHLERGWAECDGTDLENYV